MGRLLRGQMVSGYNVPFQWAWIVRGSPCHNFLSCFRISMRTGLRLGTLKLLDRTLSPERQVRNEIDLAGPEGLDAMKVDTSGLRRSLRPAQRVRLVSVDFKRSDCLRHLSSTLTEQSNSEDPFLSMPIVHARMSALSLPTERISPGT